MNIKGKNINMANSLQLHGANNSKGVELLTKKVVSIIEHEDAANVKQRPTIEGRLIRDEMALQRDIDMM